MIDKNKPWFALYDKGVPYSVIYPPVAVKQLFNSNAEAHPDRDYLIINDTKLSYGLVNLMARKAANSLVGLGVKKGDRVAIMAPNVPQYCIAFQACAKLGAIVAPVNPLAATPEVRHYIKDSGAETIIVMAAFSKGPIEILKAGDTPLKNVITFQIQDMPVDVESGSGIHDFNELAGSGSDAEPDVDVRHTDTLMLQYTGGTTGLSKGCVLSNANLVAMAYQENYWLSPVLDHDEDLRCLAAIPLYHIYGFNLNININYVNGGTIILVPQPSTENILAAVNRHEPNFFPAVPTMLIGLNQHPDIGSSKIGAIKGVISGSAPLPVEAMRTFEDLSGAVITEGYGMSETSNVITGNPTQTVRKPGGVGLPFPDNDVRIVDIDTGTKDIPLGEPGEIIVKGPTVMSGYWNNPAETAKVLHDGWLATGDIGYMDTDGHLFIVDRKKDMVLSSGFNVYPREVDELMYTHPKVLQACAFGVPDAKRGEALKLAVVLKPDQEMTAGEVRDFCKKNLSGYKVPTDVVFMTELPVTSIGKPDRKKMRQMELER
ncbi:MAG: long-chain fatty acid--CoA ligase [Actinomycetia bacterium]|nr:long-chain fatty acid--CoA ligase [Actinomycetes bacterium]MCH9768782.1 long-chain fatty acid--CoA ligase [Actinomycetes bacterium]